MEDRLIAHRQHQQRVQEYKEAAAKGCYSLILIVVALVLLRPVMVNQMLGLAGAYTTAGLLDESMRQCDKALLLDGQSSGAWHQSARVYRIQGDREMACGAYLEAVQMDPSNRAARLELAAMYIEDGRYQLAIPYLEQVRRLGPDRTSQGVCVRTSCHRASLEMLIQCYQHEKDPTKLELVLKEANIFYPDSAQAQSALNASGRS